MSKQDYKKAQCIGRFGYGNGRAGRDYCKVTCPASEHCWHETYRNAENGAAAEVSHRYAVLVQKLRDRGLTGKKARVSASRRLLRSGLPDPALDVVARNTQAGVQDRYSGTPEAYRAIKGITWVYLGIVVGYYPLAALD